MQVAVYNLGSVNTSHHNILIQYTYSEDKLSQNNSKFHFQLIWMVWQTTKHTDAAAITKKKNC